MVSWLPSVAQTARMDLGLGPRKPEPQFLPAALDVSQGIMRVRCDNMRQGPRTDQAWRLQVERYRSFCLSTAPAPCWHSAQALHPVVGRGLDLAEERREESPPCGQPFHHRDLCFRTCLRFLPPAGSNCPLTLAGGNTASALRNGPCRLLVFTHTNGVQINWSDFGVPVAEMSHPWVGEDSARHSQNGLEPCGERRVVSRWDYAHSHFTPISACWMAGTGGAEEMPGLGLHLLPSARGLCLVLQGTSKRG